MTDPRSASNLIAAAYESHASQLDLSSLGLTELPGSIGELKHLRTLYLINNNLTTVPDSVSNLSSLEALVLRGNRLTTVPKAICELSSLRSLDLWENNLTSLPEEIGNLRELVLLDLMKNSLTRVPSSIGQLSQLLHLDLRDNSLTTLPEEIGELAQLLRLALKGNPIECFPHSIARLRCFTELDLSHSDLRHVPKNIARLMDLKTLDLAGNHLSEISDEIGQLKKLQRLGLNNNKLTFLPESLGQLTRLGKLMLSENKLKSLPQGIGKLKQLTSLNVSKNELVEVPETMSGLMQLKNLSLDHNQLSKLPEAIGSLRKLEWLDLRDNQLSELPQSFRLPSNLTNLYLHGNEALGLPNEVLGPETLGLAHAKPAEILEYYFRVARGRRPLNEAKLILVGRGAVGKSSLVNRLVHNRFDPTERKTEGIQITNWPIVLKEQEEVRLNVWDFGGQEIMHATHQFFLTQRSLYLLVLSGRAGGEDADAEYWLKMIESFGGDSPVIVVMNKIKEQPFDVNRRALQNKYPIRYFVKTDCADGTGLADLRRTIERETDQLEHLRDSFPANWFEIKARLAGMDQNYLSFDDYCAICAELGELDAAAQALLASYLHSLGIVLNYKDDPRLQDTHVLNPHWVTNGIYRILNSEQLAERQGVIGLEELQHILPSAEYPTKMHRFIFDLMKKFELCFSFPDDDATYLVPELLDNQEPYMTEEFEPAACLNFQYHYTVLPAGLLPRFIVRTHALSEGLPRWRTGVILKFEQNYALVKADMQDRKVFISVAGLTSSRRRLLAIVRSDLDRIHHDIRNLQPQAIVPLPLYSEEFVSYAELTVMEQNGIKRFPKVIGSEVIHLEVDQLLNGIDLEGSRKQSLISEHRPVTLFYSYAHKDERLRDELETHLKLLQRRGLITAWYDRKIEAGEEWKQKINDNLETADIVLLLISADFIASEYCYEKEMKRALERHKKGEAHVIPIIVRDVNWSKSPFSWLQALPKDGLAVTKWTDKDSAWRNVAEGIERVIEADQRRLRPSRRELMSSNWNIFSK